MNKNNKDIKVVLTKENNAQKKQKESSTLGVCALGKMKLGKGVI